MKIDHKLILRLLCSALIFLGTIFCIKCILRIPAVSNIFSPNVLSGKALIIADVIYWLIIFLEYSIIPGSYVPFILFANGTAMATNKIFFLIFTTSAVIIGRAVAYFVGYKFGGKLLRWSAGKEEIYDKWCTVLNKPVGKWTYAITVAAPFFPDFILALVAGSIKINFIFYMIINSVCKFIENIILIII